MNEKIALSSVYLDLIEEYVILHDSNFRIIEINEAGEKFLRKKGKEDIYNRPCQEICPFRNIDKNLVCPIVIAKNTKKIEKQEFVTDTGEIWLVKIYPILDKKKDLEGFVEVIIDITEQKKAEIALQKSEKKLLSIVDVAHELIYELNIDGDITFMNQRSLDYFGYPPEHFIGKKVWEAGSTSEQGEIIKTAFYEIIETKEPVSSLETTNTHKNGSLVHVLTDGIPIFDDQGELEGYRVFDHNITERKQAEEIQRMAYKHIEENIQEFANLVDGIRNPLMIILGTLDLKHPDFEEKIVEQVDKITSITNLISTRWDESTQFREILIKQLLE